MTNDEYVQTSQQCKIVVPGLDPGTHNPDDIIMVYYIYILASRPNGTLYIGVTNNISRRVWEHKQGRGSVFVKKYQVTRLVYMEMHSDIKNAIQREKTMKEWKRQWKIDLIEKDNPNWDDLYEKINA